MRDGRGAEPDTGGERGREGGRLRERRLGVFAFRKYHRTASLVRKCICAPFCDKSPWLCAWMQRLLERAVGLLRVMLFVKNIYI